MRTEVAFNYRYLVPRLSLADVCVLIKIFDMEEGMEENSREQNLNATRSDKFGRFSFVLLKVQHDRGWRLSASILVFEAWEAQVG